jgi:hypothetical protein
MKNMDNFFDAQKQDIERELGVNGYFIFSLEQHFKIVGKEARWPAHDWAKQFGWVYGENGPSGLIATNSTTLSQGMARC